VGDTDRAETIFLKLGGSLITDKTHPQSTRADTLARVAAEIATALRLRPHLRLVLGHGSGSFGHFAGRVHRTRDGVRTPEQWRGFAKTGSAAQKLNCLVTAALQEAGVPVWSLQPSASAVCHDGELVNLMWQPIRQSLDQGLVPLVYGDVALDTVRGGTIISTEEIFSWLSSQLRPQRIVLAGVVPGVFRSRPSLGPEQTVQHDSSDILEVITPGSAKSLTAELGGSHGTDVTGGMQAKVRVMCDLVEALSTVRVQIVSGEQPGLLMDVLLNPESKAGTLVRADRPNTEERQLPSSCSPSHCCL